MGENHRHIANTILGPVEGVRENGVTTFLGIPYAAPPVDDLRWRAAQPHSGWEGVRSATAVGLTAPQPWRPGGDPIMGGHAEPPFGEDCLTLNVWTPGVDDRRRPVLIWIHGGGFLTGSGNSDKYAGTELAINGDIVVVGINYRLGAFGFLEGLGDSNLWLSDQVAALKWVSASIAEFGGDPTRITVAGQSGGGFSTAALTAHPETRDLFDRAIVISPPLGLDLPTPEESIERSHALAKALGHDNLEGLRSESWERLVQGTLSVIEQYSAFGEWNLPFLPVLDSDTLPQHPLDSLVQSDAEVLLGWTHDEATFRFGLDPSAQAATTDQVSAWAERRYGEAAEDLAGTYRRAHGNARPVDVLTDLLSDELFRMPALEVAERRASTRPIWAYQFDFPSAAYGGVLGAPHCIELPFMFNNFHAWESAPFVQGLDQEARDRVAGAFHRSIIEFVRNGDPANDQTSSWPRYAGGERTTMLFDERVRAESDPVKVWREAQDLLRPVAGSGHGA